MRNLHRRPADIKDRREGNIPSILATHGAEEIKSDEDAKKSRCDKQASHVVPAVSLAYFELDLVTQVADNRCRDTISNLTR